MQSEVIGLLKQQTGGASSATESIEAMLLASNEVLMKELQVPLLLLFLFLFLFLFHLSLLFVSNRFYFHRIFVKPQQQLLWTLSNSNSNNRLQLRLT
jgi:hypothetical protein